MWHFLSIIWMVLFKPVSSFLLSTFHLLINFQSCKLEFGRLKLEVLPILELIICWHGHSIYWWLIRSYYEPVIHRLEFILATVFSGISIILFVCYWCVHVEPHLSRSTSGHYEELCGNRLRYRQIIFGVHGSFSRWGRYCLTLPSKYNSLELSKMQFWNHFLLLLFYHISYDW